MMWILLAALLSASSVAADLNGRWRQDCVRGFFKEEFFQGENATYYEHNFQDGNCELPSVSTISLGTLVQGDAVGEPVGASELDFIFSSVKLLPATEKVAAYFESISLCGLTNWKVGEDREITGLVCDLYGVGSRVQIPRAGLRKYGIVKAEADALYFGKLSPERDGSSPLTRPRELDPFPFRKVN